MISPEDIVACICEGNSEKNIMSMLLEDNKLIFTKDQLLDDQFFQGKYRNPQVFSDQYLTMDYGNKDIVVLVIKDDSRTYVIKEPYSSKIKSKYLIVTSPEIEMLMIHSVGLYDEYKNKHSEKNPSLFLADKWGISKSKIKSKKFISDFYTKHSLTDAIKLYSQKSKKSKKSIFLYDLLIIGT